MNGTYYPNPTFPTASTNNYQDTVVTIDPILPREEINLDNILKFNKGKKVTIFMSYNYNEDKKNSYTGIIEESDNNYIILSSPETGNWYLLLTKYLDYIEFEEKINITQM